MNSFELAQVIRSLRPEAEFTFTDNDYSTIEWIKLEGDAPTQAEIKKGFTAYQAAQKAETETKAQAKETAQAKLAALGLTVEDLTALGL